MFGKIIFCYAEHQCVDWSCNKQ